jgi:hypothetical protein
MKLTPAQLSVLRALDCGEWLVQHRGGYRVTDGESSKPVRRSVIDALQTYGYINGAMAITNRGRAMVAVRRAA